MIEEINKEVYDKMIALKIYPIKFTFPSGEIRFGYMLHEDGSYIGTSEPPKEEDWLASGGQIK